MLGFLHTAATHVPAFERLLREVDPTAEGRHAVDAPLLADAAAAGQVDAALRRRVATAVDALRDAGARLVVCTCTTIGDAAESAGRPGAPVLRLDRPMAEEALRRGNRVAVVAALPTAFEATAALLRRLADERQQAVAIRHVACPEAWQLFERGDLDGYHAAVAGAARAAAADADVVLLGQASMAAALDQLRALPVLASAALGVRAAVEMYRALGPHS
jgi:aspartate/glutamate racemase